MLTRDLNTYYVYISLFCYSKGHILAPTHLAIATEYVASEKLFDRTCNAGRFNEDEVLLVVYKT